jgi:hypothetical protein
MSLPWLELLNNLMLRYLGKDAKTSILKPQGANLVVTINRFFKSLIFLYLFARYIFRYFFARIMDLYVTIIEPV